jgi:hypothetical protein
MVDECVFLIGRRHTTKWWSLVYYMMRENLMANELKRQDWVAKPSVPDISGDSERRRCGCAAVAVERIEVARAIRAQKNFLGS